MTTAYAWDFVESETMEGGTDLVVHVVRAWWQVWRPRGEIRIAMDRGHVIRFYQTLHKRMRRGMIVGGSETLEVGHVLRALREVLVANRNAVGGLLPIREELYREGHVLTGKLYDVGGLLVAVDATLQKLITSLEDH